MKNSTKEKITSDEMRKEYDFDFSKSKPNPYAAKLKRQASLIELEPDVQKIFHTSEQVNKALRAIITAYPIA